MTLIARGSLLLLLGVFSTAISFAAPVITLTPDRPDAVYRPGEKITWNVKVTGDSETPITTATYVLKKGGAAPIDQGTVNFQNGAATIQSAVNEPCTILAQVTVRVPGQKDLIAFGGAAVSPDQLKPSAPCPDDFDAFWKANLINLPPFHLIRYWSKKTAANPASIIGKSRSITSTECMYRVSWPALAVSRNYPRC